MKKGFALLTIVLTVLTMAQAKPKPNKEMVVLSNKNNVLYFKVNRLFVGGKVEIYDENKNILEADSLPHTHTMIYFDEMPAGHYTVKVKKGNEALEFKYNSI